MTGGVDTNNSQSFSDDLDLALSLARHADALTMSRFRAADLEVDAKPDLTPVSDADLACERQLRELLQQHRPDDAVLGEEFGGDFDAVKTGRHWVMDPIDGTKNFVRGVPVWATLIALIEDGYPRVGIVSAPALSRRWWGRTGNESGAWTQFADDEPRRCEVSAVAELSDASLSISSLSGWKDRGLRDNLIALTDEVWRLRGYGDFFSYCLVAEGAVDIAAEPEVSLWDLAALVPVVEGAGGTFSSLDGNDGPFGGDAVATNGLLHGVTLKRLTS